MNILRYLFCCGLLMASSLSVFAQGYDSLWKELDVYKSQNRPRSVIGVADKIIARASADGNVGELMKARLVRCLRVFDITPDSLSNEIAAVEAMRNGFHNEADKAVAASMLAELYTYDEEYSDYVTSMALEAVKNSGSLVNVSSVAYKPLVDEGESDVCYNHSLYHLLVERTVKLLKRSGGDCYATVDSLYAELGKACEANPQMKDGAVITALDRLKWRRDRRRDVSSELGNSLYAAGLDSLIVACADRQTCVEAIHAKAQDLSSKGNNREALQLCQDGERKYPKYGRVGILTNLKQKILAPSLTLRAEALYYPSDSCRIRVSHKNVSGLTIIVSRDGRRLQNNDFVLVKPDDYNICDTTLTISLKEPGKYEVTAMADGANPVKRSVAVSRLRVLSLALPGDEMELVVVDGLTGKPQSGASLKIFSSKGGVLKTLTTDDIGCGRTEWSRNYRSVKAEMDGDNSMPNMYIYGGTARGGQGNATTDVVRLLTDRSIYRPGQRILVKGVAYRRGSDSAEVITGKSYKLTLLDVNRQEVASQQVVTNDFGSFDAALTLPASCLNGTFTLFTDGGSTTVRVEEYKRPTFEVTIDEPSGSYMTGDSIRLIASAKTLNGVALVGATFEYSVKRNRWRLWRDRNGGETISKGIGVIGENGRFAINALLSPERPGDKRSYCFMVEAIVTSAAGETQKTTCGINAGQSSLILLAEADELIMRSDSACVNLKAVNMSGATVDVRGEYILYRIAEDTTKVASGKNVNMNKPIYVNRTWSRIKSGRYMLSLSAKDDKGREVTAERTFTIYSKDDKRPPVPTKEWWREDNLLFDAAHPAVFSYGTSEHDAYVMARLMSKDKLLESKLLNLSDTIINYEIPYREEYGDGVNMLFVFVKNGEVYRRVARMVRRLPERELKMEWSTFRDKLRPGDDETWSLTVKRPAGTAADAEVAAMMYDASLDRLWQRGQSLKVGFNLYVPYRDWNFSSFGSNGFYLSFDALSVTYYDFLFDSFCLPERFLMAGGIRTRGVRMYKSMAVATGDAVAAADLASVKMESVAVNEGAEREEDSGIVQEDIGADVRSNLAETAFFYPALRTDSAGAVKVEFTVPESLTEWRVNAYAHTVDMNYGLLTALTKTTKELMVMPNMPRFVRSADKTSIAASIVNLSDCRQEGTAQLTLFDPYTENCIEKKNCRFVVDAGETATVAFCFDVPGGMELLGCRIVANGIDFSDGEQHLLPVLSDRMHLVETLAMNVGAGEYRTYSTESLFNGHSTTATNKRITVELTGNTAWTAVQTLPTITTPTSDNVFAWAAALYANSLSQYIVKQHPEIKSTVEAWRRDSSAGTTMVSNLQRNEELKSIILTETPWVLDARGEREQRERIAQLFDDNAMKDNLVTAQRKLNDLQLPDGSWPWFKGMRGSVVVTGYVAELNARLALLKGEPLSGEQERMQNAAIDFLHSEMAKRYHKLAVKERKDYSLSDEDLKYLYVVALSGRAVKEKYIVPYQFYLSKVKYLLDSDDMGIMAQAAVVLHHSGNLREANGLIRSMREYLSTDADGALSFAFNERLGAFGRRQMSVHVEAMEAFDLVASDSAVVEKMKLWLLQRKRCQGWNSTVSTADAVYALLMRGTPALTSHTDLSAELGDHRLSTSDAGAVGGLAYVKDSYSDSIAVVAKNIALRNTGGGVAWGAVFAEFDEDLDVVNGGSSGLTVEREIVGADSFKVGDRVVVRTTLRVPSRMDFVVLKVAHAACMEPESTVSGYRWGNNVGYYQEVKDAATNYYFDSIGKGVYRFETIYRVSRVGNYQSGISSAYCSYAPEYSAHSASQRVEVR